MEVCATMVKSKVLITKARRNNHEERMDILMGGVGREKDERWEGFCDLFFFVAFNNFLYLKMSYYRNEQR
jgi:hypothetical protein